MLFSATQTSKVEELAKLSLKRAPVYVSVDDPLDVATPSELEQVNLLSNFIYVLGICSLR